MIVSRKRQSFLWKMGAYFMGLAFMSSAAVHLTACSSDGRSVKIASSIDDPVGVSVVGVDNSEVKDNIDAYLLTLPVISRKKASIYEQEIRSKIS
ncbi:MAG: hypothetical protein ACI4UM_01325, partial [Succinivibrio sp.]